MRGFKNMEYKDINEFTAALEVLSKVKKFIVGAGTYGGILGQYFDKHNIEWEGFVDKNSDLSFKNGKKVISYQNIRQEDAYYIISPYLYKQEIFYELKKQGIPEEKIIMYGEQDIFYEIYDDLVHWKQYTDRLKEYRGKYEGKRCFIIGNGPSLTLSDLERLKGEITFACNSIYAVYEHTFWRPSFHCAWDNIFCKKMMSKKEDMKKLTSECGAFFTTILGDGFQYRECEDIGNLFFIKSEQAVSENTGLPLFSEDCSKQIYSSGTVTYMMLQLAVYMGFSKIYLLGMDTSFSTERFKDGKVVVKRMINHQNLIEENDEIFSKSIMQKYGYTYIADIDLQMEAYQSAQQYADSHKIKIYNATRGGKLEIFERVDFDSLFNGK